MPAPPLEQRALELLAANTQLAERDGRLFRFTVPSVGAYPFQWFWDSCFHAVVWSRFDPGRAADELRGLLAWQEQSGALPHVVFWNRARVKVLAWHYLESRGVPLSTVPARTAGIQPPVVAQAVERAVLAGAEELLDEALPALERYHRFLASARDPDRDGLISVVSQFEAGLDFSPAYDGRLASATLDPLSIAAGPRLRQLRNKLARFDLERIFRFGHHCEDVLVNALYGDALHALARLAERAGQAELASWARQRAAAVTVALLERSWDPRRGFFASLLGTDERPVRARTIQGLAPLLLPDLPRETAAALVEHLTNPAEFWTPYPVPLVARDERSFTRDNRVWGLRLLSRGPLTMALNWLLVRGLRRHGYGDIADGIAARSRELVERGGFNEFFDPLSGRPVGVPDFGWATLALDM